MLAIHLWGLITIAQSAIVFNGQHEIYQVDFGSIPDDKLVWFDEVSNASLASCTASIKHGNMQTLACAHRYSCICAHVHARA